MTSKRSEKFKKLIIIIVAVIAVLAVVSFILAGVFSDKADEIRNSSSMLFGAAKSNIATMEMLSGLFVGLGVFSIVCAVVYAAIMFGIYYRTNITVADGTVKGCAVKGIKRVEFSAPLSEVKMPMTDGKMVLAFNVKGVRYVVYTDDVNTFYNLLDQADKK